MKVWQLCWLLIKNFGFRAEVTAKVIERAFQLAQESMYGQFGDQVRDRFVHIIKHKAGTVPLAANNPKGGSLIQTTVKPVGAEPSGQFDVKGWQADITDGTIKYQD